MVVTPGGRQCDRSLEDLIVSNPLRFDGLLFELFEHVLIAFMLSGVFWNVAAGYQLIPSSAVPKGMVLTIVLLVSVFTFETINDQTALH